MTSVGNYLVQAAPQGEKEPMFFLLKSGPIQTAIDDNSNFTAHGAAAHGQFAILRLLLQWNSDLKASNRDGNTTLHLAAMNGFLK
ncbi:ankyrin repeat protein [Sphaerosporella brunnea]|uniref:Ankyrin repeat protein n=1 Tax=Sphaerosporella brunnea TaxID=1250544 RepID=A0A5J5EJ33_9PEZI|nr:ankyrin repeat protein [Sphaerosporella brunnea]